MHGSGLAVERATSSLTILSSEHKFFQGRSSLLRCKVLELADFLNKPLLPKIFCYWLGSVEHSQYLPHEQEQLLAHRVSSSEFFLDHMQTLHFTREASVLFACRSIIPTNDSHSPTYSGVLFLQGASWIRSSPFASAASALLFGI